MPATRMMYEIWHHVKNAQRHRWDIHMTESSCCHYDTTVNAFLLACLFWRRNSPYWLPHDLAASSLQLRFTRTDDGSSGYQNFEVMLF